MINIHEPKFGDRNTLQHFSSRSMIDINMRTLLQKKIVDGKHVLNINTHILIF